MLLICILLLTKMEDTINTQGLFGWLINGAHFRAINSKILSHVSALHTPCSSLSLLSWKSRKYLKFWVYVCSLGYAACNAHLPYYIVICDLSGSTIIFSHHCTPGVIFGEKKFMNKNCVFWFSVPLSEKCLILRIIQWDVIINVHRSSSKVLLCMSDFNETWIFSTN
jgi:hypothetical protein